MHKILREAILYLSESFDKNAELVLRDIMIEKGIKPVHTGLPTSRHDNRVWISQIGKFTVDQDDVVRSIAIEAAKSFKPIQGFTAISNCINDNEVNGCKAYATFLIYCFERIQILKSDDIIIANAVKEMLKFLNVIAVGFFIPERYLRYANELGEQIATARTHNDFDAVNVLSLMQRIITELIRNTSSLGTQLLSSFITLTRGNFLGGFFSTRVLWDEFVDACFPILFQ